MLGENEEILQALDELRREHRSLDDEVGAMQGSANSDPLKIARLKKRKLALKDRIGFLEDQLTPDIIA